jgi:hypothetical protein
VKTPLALVLASILAPVAFAQEDAKEAPAEKPARQLEAELTIQGFAIGGADFDGDNGDVSVSNVGAELGVDIPAGERGTLSLSIGSTWSFYDFGGDAGFGASEPWEDVVQYTAGLRYSRKINDEWGWFTGGFVASSGEQDADFSATITGAGYAGASYAASEKFRIAFGLGYATRLEDDGYVIPIINFNWKLADRWTLSTDTQAQGAGIKLAYQACDSASIFLSGGYLFREYRLSEDGATPDGVGRDSGIPIAIGTDWTISPQVTFSVRGGMLFGREFELDDREGQELQELDADAAPFLTAALRFSF